MKISYNKWQGNEKFRHLINDKDQFIFNRGGRGTGKTIAVIREVIAKIIIGKQQDVLILRNVETSNRQSIYKEFKAEIDKITNQWSATVSPLEIKVGNCSVIFRGMDKPERLKSIGGNIGCVIFEEATEMRSWEECEIVIQSIRKVADPKFIFNYNADNPIHWLREKEENLPARSRLIVSTIFDNKFLTQDFIDRQLAKKEVDEKIYNINVLGMWENLGTTVYDIDNKNYYEKPEKVVHNAISIGVDLGDVQATSFVATGFYDSYSKVQILENYSHANKDSDVQKSWVDYVDDFVEFYNKVRREYNYRMITIQVESATGGSGFIQLLRERGILASKVKKNNIRDRVMQTNYLLKAGRLTLNKDFKLAEEFKHAERDIEAKNNNYFRLDENDHSINAFEYSFIKYLKYAKIGEETNEVSIKWN